MSTYSMESLYNKIVGANYSYVHSTYKTKSVLESDDDIKDIKTESDTFQSKIKKLKNYSTNKDYDNKEIRNINNFVKEFNAFKKKTDLTSNTEITKKMEELESLLKENKKNLKKAGVSISDKGFLGFDSEDFEDVDTKVLKELFSGNDSFINKASKIIRSIKSVAEENEQTVSYIKYHPTTSYTKQELATASNCIALNNTFLNYYNGINYDESLESEFGTFANLYNMLLEDSNVKGSTYLENIKTATAANASNLNTLGFSIDNDTNELSFAANDIDSDTKKEAFLALFDSTNTDSFSSVMSSNLKKIYNQVIKADEIGATIDYGA